MGSVNIAIKDEAYEFLSSLKGKNESFSEVILGFKTKKKGDPLEILKFFGVLKNENIDWKNKEKRMNSFKESFNKRLNNDRNR